jgi:hypothetical protein
MAAADPGEERRMMQAPAGNGEARALVILSPGRIDMAGIAVMAKAMGMSVAALARQIYEAPTVVLRDLGARDADALARHCGTLGLEVRTAPNDVEARAAGRRYQVAVHVADIARLPHAIETVARVAGLDPDAAYRLLAAPPGQLLGGLGEPAVEALRARFGEGIELLAAPDGDGLFDLHVSPGAAAAPAVRRLVGGRTGLMPLGLDAGEAEALFPQLPKGTARLLPRGLLRYDLVLARGVAAPPLALPFLSRAFGVPPGHAARLAGLAPLALAERLTFDEAEALLAEAREASLPLRLEASGFERCDVHVDGAADARALGEALALFSLTPPARLPARVATDLGDLDARCLAHALERAGGRVRFAEVAS